MFAEHKIHLDGKSNSRKRTWSAIWLAPRTGGQAAQYVFRVRTPDGGPPVCSQPFRLNEPVVRVPMPPRPVAGACPPERSGR